MKYYKTKNPFKLSSNGFRYFLMTNQFQLAKRKYENDDDGIVENSFFVLFADKDSIINFKKTSLFSYFSKKTNNYPPQ